MGGIRTFDRSSSAKPVIDRLKEDIIQHVKIQVMGELVDSVTSS
jgi:hypothetical protein